MWNSVYRALDYGWNVGRILTRKMSDKIVNKKSNGDEDVCFSIDKMPEEVNVEKSELSEQPSEQKNKLKQNVNLVNEANSQAPVQFDTIEDNAGKSSFSNSGSKKPMTSNEHNQKMLFSKTERRVRPKNSSDLKWNPLGNSGSDSKWYNCENLETSQSDLSQSKWIPNIDNTVRVDSSHKSHIITPNSSESDIFPPRSMISSHPSEFSGRPYPLFKSSSSSQLPSIRNNYMPPNRQWKYNSNTVRPISVLSMQQTYVPQSFYHPNHPSFGRNFCSCSENHSKKSNRTESILSLTEDAETPEGLSWRRLHMSRAKLKATATTSELLSGFAMVAMVELQINKPTAVPEWLFVLFAVCTTILVSVHIFALMISTYLLPNIDAVSKLHVSSLVTESPHDRMKSFIELAWAFSTILGLFLFLVEIAILCWVKFWDYSFTAAMSATMIIIPVLILFVAFAMHFYHSLVVIKCKSSVSNMQELENMKRQLDSVSPA